jgi:ADP-ribose pyrophosphatase
MEKKIRTIATLNAHSFSVSLDDVLLQNGAAGRRIKIDHPEAAAIVPFISEDQVLMVRQFRYALGKETLEIPAGKVDPGEKPEACARRELLEETGFDAELMQLVLTYAPAIGYSNELIHIFSARQLRRTRADIDEREISSVEEVSLDQVRDMVRKGLIEDGKTLLALSYMGLINESKTQNAGVRIQHADTSQKTAPLK